MSESNLKDRVLVVIPTFNNINSIGGVINHCLEVHSQILVVDDGSNDGSSEVIDSISGISVLRHERNLGKGAGIITAFEYAFKNGFEYILTCDGDGQHDPDDIQNFVQSLKPRHGDQIVIGCRNFDSREAGDVPHSSRFGRSFSNFWVMLESGLRLSDTQSGFRLYSVSPKIYQNLTTTKYDCEIDLLVQYAWARANFSEIPIRVFYPEREKRVSHFRPWLDNFRISLLHATLVFLNIIRLLKLFKPYPLEKRSEAPLSFMMPIFLSIFGKSFSLLIMPFPLLFFYLTASAPRRGIEKLYARLSKADGLFAWRRTFINYWYFGASLVDRLTLGQVQVLSSEDAEGKVFHPGSIYIGAHYGDWLLSATRLSGKRKVKVGIIMDPTLTPKFHAMIKKLDLHQVTLIDGSLDGLELALTIKGFLDEGGAICLLGDRPLPRGRTLSGNFLGKDAQFPAGPFQLAVALKVPTYFYTSRRQSRLARTTYAVICENMWDGQGNKSAEMLLTRYIELLETQVKSHPQHWFNFYDFWEHDYG